MPLWRSIHLHFTVNNNHWCCIWHIQIPRVGPTALYMVYMAVYGIYRPQSKLHCPVYSVHGIYRSPELAPLPCIWCIWLYMLYMAYTDSQRWPYIPVYGCICCIWHLQTPRACPTALYMVYIAVYAVYAIYRPPEHAPLPCIWCIWLHIHIHIQIFTPGDMLTLRKSRYSRLFLNVEALKPERKLIADVAKDYMFSQNRPTGNLAKASRFNRRESGE